MLGEKWKRRKGLCYWWACQEGKEKKKIDLRYLRSYTKIKLLIQTGVSALMLKPIKITFFFCNDVHSVKCPRATQVRGIKIKRHSLWKYVVKIPVSSKLEQIKIRVILF